MNKEEEYTKEQEEQIALIDRAITELVYDKVKLVKAYNYYRGYRDPEQFRHLEENFGLGTASSLEFVPLVRKHIDVLIGEYLSAPLLPRVSCKDKKTLSKISEDRKFETNKQVKKKLKEFITTLLTDYKLQRGDQEIKAMNKELSKTQSEVDKNFISDYEIAAQNVVSWLIQSRDIDFINIRKNILLDLLITGITYFKTGRNERKEQIILEDLDPFNTFVDRNKESPYLKNSPRGVIRKYLTKDQILTKYGAHLTAEDLEDLETMTEYNSFENTIFARTYESVTTVSDSDSDGILGGFEVSPVYMFGSSRLHRNYKVYPVYEVQWLKAEKKGDDFVMCRYEGVRINNSIYILTGKVEESGDAALTINGMFYADRNGEPFSIVLATANLQDKFDILNFYKDNIIAESGSVGDWIDVAFLPNILGKDLTERLMKWKAYKKQGLALLDSSQEGGNLQNTHYQGFDDALKADTIQAIDLAIQRVEDTCSTITGVFREKLGGVEQRDAVSNVKVGIRQSSFITKQYYHVMDLLTREMLLDLLGQTKKVFKKGFVGTLVLGERLNKIFTALPEHFTMSQHDVHIAASDEILEQQQLIKTLAMEFVKAKEIDPEIILEVINSASLTDMKNSVGQALKAKREENGEMNNAMQQLEQMKAQLQEMQSALQQAEGKVEQLNEEKMQIEKEKLDFEKELKWFEARSKDTYDKSNLELEKKRVDLEALQLVDRNKNNDEIKDE